MGESVVDPKQTRMVRFPVGSMSRLEDLARRNRVSNGTVLAAALWEVSDDALAKRIARIKLEQMDPAERALVLAIASSREPGL